jgi:hypothetical protein
MLGACGGGGGGGAAPAVPATSPIGYLDVRTTLLPGGHTPQRIASGFFDGDAWPDIAVGHQAQGGLSILLGRGDGTFEAVAPVIAGLPGPHSVSVRTAFLDLDPFVDLVVVDNVDCTVQTYLGRGDGSFDPVFGVPLALSGSNLFDLAVGLLDGDVLDDVVFVLSTGVHVYVATGLGGLAPVPGGPYLAGLETRTVRVAKADTVPGLDLVVCSSPLDTVHILRGDDNAGFSASPMSPVPVPGSPVAADIASIDGAGGPDLVVLSLSGFRLYLGTGDVTFTPTSQGQGGLLGIGGALAVIPRPRPGFPQHDDVILLSLAFPAPFALHLTRLRPLDDLSGIALRTSQTTPGVLAFEVHVLDADQDGELDLLLTILHPGGLLEVRLGD